MHALSISVPQVVEATHTLLIAEPPSGGEVPTPRASVHPFGDSVHPFRDSVHPSGGGVPTCGVGVPTRMHHVTGQPRPSRSPRHRMGLGRRGVANGRPVVPVRLRIEQLRGQTSQPQRIDVTGLGDGGPRCWSQLTEARCRTPRQLKLVNALCSGLDLAGRTH